MTTTAEIIWNHARQCGLNVTFDFPTPADGNCWYHAVIQSYCHQRGPLPQQIADHKTLRKAVCDFVRENTVSKEHRFKRTLS